VAAQGLKQDLISRTFFEKNQLEICFCTKVPERVYCVANLPNKLNFFLKNIFEFLIYLT